ARAAEILREGLRDSDARFLSFTGNLVATGLRGVLAQLIEAGFFNVVITTCGTVDHDIARSMGGRYYRGDFDLSDVELSERGIHRLGNVLIPRDSYGTVIESYVRELVGRLARERLVWGVREVLQEVGRDLSKDSNSILGSAYRSGARVYVPGITDGAFGTSLFIFSQFEKVRLDPFRDMKELSDIVFSSKKSAALVLGGGISKHHTIWWNQFRGGLDYAVYVTTAVEWDGSLSGARTREAISWGKISSRGKHVTVYGDATVILPILAAYLIDVAGLDR
ncbi:MAG: deoxyhypusine synthase, partial [Sulfolobales archaeon]|nr:deoxyhypusine synthase [Sulfolobales archaeon]MDW8010418.1 deoxyhypusine synthase [Sulfolobales archaeon]